MVKDPWPCYWTPCESTRDHNLRFCRYSKRFSLPCGTSRRMCHACYMKQQDFADEDIYLGKAPEPVVHICDVCGEEIERINEAAYLELEDRRGYIFEKAELCERCQTELRRWLSQRIEP